MHIAEGVLSAPVLISGAVVAAGATAVGLKKMSYDDVPRTAMLASAFFTVSLIHVPIGPASAHLILNGLAGLILGWAVFPALLIGLLLQAVLFGFGGLTTLGVNTLVMALPGLVCYYALSPLLRRGTVKEGGLISGSRAIILAGLGCGFIGVGLSCLLLAGALFLSAREFIGVAQLAIAGNAPIMVIDGFVSAAALSFLVKVKPDALPLAQPVGN